MNEIITLLEESISFSKEEKKMLLTFLQQHPEKQQEIKDILVKEKKEIETINANFVNTLKKESRNMVAEIRETQNNNIKQKFNKIHSYIDEVRNKEKKETKEELEGINNLFI